MTAAGGASWVPEGPLAAGPVPARVYEALLGGCHTFAADRQMAERLLAVEPDAGYWAVSNRLFLARAVRLVLGAGVRQVLDIGAGLPTLASVHQIAARLAPDARVVYVDIDPVAVEHAHQILGTTPMARAVAGDLRDPRGILAHPDVTGLLDFARPVALLLVAVLHFVADADDPVGVIAQLRDAVPSGSFLVISHAAPQPEARGEAVDVVREYSARTAPLTLRSREQIGAMFEGWDLVDPGMTGVAFWRTEPGELDDPRERARAARIPGWVGVAVKP